MKLLVRRVEWQFQRNLQRQVFANELRIKLRRMKECFPGDTLPSPTAEVIAAWNDLPNDTIDILPMSVRPGRVFLRAPPPTPTELTFDMDDATSDDSSLNGSTDDSWPVVDDTDPPAPYVVAFPALEDSTTNEGDSMSRCNYPDQSLDLQTNEEDSPQYIHSNSPSSGHESLSSSSRSSRTPVGFDNMVDQWLLDYRARGADPFIESLIAFGVVSLGTAPLASRIARAVVRKVEKISCTEGKNLENAIRFSSLAAFKKCWDSNNTWMEVSFTRANTLSPTPYGVNIASFVGSLFDARISNTKDIHLCLSLLLEGERCFDRLCAMHALLVQANDKLCKNRNLPALMQFKEGITSRDRDSGEYIWVTTPRSKTIIADILGTIERWLVSQALRRDQHQMSSSHRTIRQRAVGPRLRNLPLQIV
ncbi:hypothetical protein J3R83DRAFT_13807 [Lanmaoa asiatica]|nr:hypothetical protein J3R83DRAFT_13807 [Lanmaoa asiatica]